MMSASPGMLGGANAQVHLRQTCVFLNMYPINKPLVIVTFAQDKFDSNGKLLDDNTKKFLGQLLENLANWARKYHRPEPTERMRSSCVPIMQIGASRQGLIVEDMDSVLTSSSTHK